jgi:hypothetical protein
MDTIKVTIKSNLTENLEQFKQVSRLVAKDAYDLFVQATPKGDPSTWKNPKAAPKNYVPGNARRKTTMDSATSFTADYPYAERLDQGWSNQAPKGMVEPLLKEIPNMVDKHVNAIKRGQQ